jgi:hypothetical protein
LIATIRRDQRTANALAATVATIPPLIQNPAPGGREHADHDQTEHSRGEPATNHFTEVVNGRGLLAGASAGDVLVELGAPGGGSA